MVNYVTPRVKLEAQKAFRDAVNSAIMYNSSRVVKKDKIKDVFEIAKLQYIIVLNRLAKAY